MISQPQPAVLLLADGTAYYGKSCGAIGITTGEIAFNTATTGYQEVFTDPSYYGQVLCMAAAHVGNYGVHDAETESENCKVAGVLIKNFSDTASRIGPIGTLHNYLVRDNIVGICDIDTRALVQHIRQAGAMNCIVSSTELDIHKLSGLLAKTPSMEGLELSSKVTCNMAYTMGEQDALYKVAVLDLGVKKNILRCLSDRGVLLKIFPMSSTHSEIMAWQPDAMMFSNGPGDPSAMSETIKLIGSLIATEIPCFGICLGHQLIGLSQGLKTEKMYNGHRGINHPIKNLMTGKCEITSQNHGFVISQESMRNHDDFEITHIHLNDQTIAGMRMKSKPVFSVQYHPEASAGPHDSRYLFDQFIVHIKEAKLQNA